MEDKRRARSHVNDSAGGGCTHSEGAEGIAWSTRTDILRFRNIRFFKNGVKLQHNNLYLEFADCVSITFEWQKKDTKGWTLSLRLHQVMQSCVQSGSRLRLLEGSGDTTEHVTLQYWQFGDMIG